MSNAFLSNERLGLSAGSQGPRTAAPSLPKPGVPPRAPGYEGGFGAEQPPLNDGESMTMSGVVSAAGVLFVLLIGAAFVGWNTVESLDGQITSFPGWTMGLVAVGFGLLGLSYFMPHLTKFIAPAYAIVEGLIIGAFTHLYEVRYEGIALQAALVTIGVFGSMLVLYSTRLVKVTDKFRRIVVTATMGVMAVYLFQFVSNIAGFGFEVPYLHDSGPIGIALSLFLVGLAAFNYLLDFDFVERATKAGAPKEMEWVAAFGLLVTTVWLFFEILRLLAKLRD